MIKELEAKRAEQLAAEYFGNGYHCAEAVAAAVLETMGEESSSAIAYCSAFGGGLGESFTETCGVVSGSLIVIGHFYARKGRGESWQDAAQLGGDVVRQFAALYGTCNCGELRERFGEENQMNLCRKLVRQGAETLIASLSEKWKEESGKNFSDAECTSCS